MKAISIQQPWAWAIMHGPKGIENRTWFTHYTGPLLIHAGLSRKRMPSGIQFLRGLGLTPRADEIEYGRILGMVHQIDCRSVRELAPRDEWDRIFAEGPACHVYEHPQLLLESIPYRGQQGMFEIPDWVLKGATWERQCTVCGCTDSRACDPVCFWEKENICSKCWAAGARKGK